MAFDKARFRTIKEEFFLPADVYEGDAMNKNNDAVFIAVLAIGIVAAASLGTILSFARFN